MADQKPKRPRRRPSQVPGRRGVPAKGNGGRGQPSWAPTDEQRLMVRICKADGGFTNEAIANALGVDADTLAKHCKAELSGGKIEVDSKIAAKLVQKCMAGDMTAIIWYEKTRRGMKEVDRHELVGKDGGPIDSRLLVAEVTPEMTAQDAAAAYAKLLG